MQDILPYNKKKGTKGDTNLTWLGSWNSEQYVHIYLSQSNTDEKPYPYLNIELQFFMCNFHIHINIKCSYIKQFR